MGSGPSVESWPKMQTEHDVEAFRIVKESQWKKYRADCMIIGLGFIGTIGIFAMVIAATPSGKK